MDNLVAKHICIEALRCTRVLSELMEFSGEFCDERESEFLKNAIVSIMGRIGTDVIGPILKSSPAVDKQFEISIAEYKVAIY